MNIIDDASQLRQDIRLVDQRVCGLQQHDVFDRADLEKAAAGEMRANLQLAHRHLEDARMRLGKVIQAYEGHDIFDVPAVADAVHASRRPSA